MAYLLVASGRLLRDGVLSAKSGQTRGAASGRNVVLAATSSATVSSVNTILVAR